MLEEYKNKILSFYESHKRMPTYAEIAKLVGFKSKNAVAKLVEKLVDAGIVRKSGNGSLIPTSLFHELPLLGSVKAGLPSAAEEVRDTVSIEDLVIDKKDSTYVLEVDGDSMIDAHIADGDLVVVERTSRVKDGDIVIAEVDGEWTMKYYRDRGGKVWLEPANKKYAPIYPTEELRIGAKVKAVIRKYR